MLQKLGRRLTLLNMVISGAILLVMALIALGIAEGTIATQYENDLTMYARSMFSMMYRTVNGNTEYIIQTPQRYIVVLESVSGDIFISSEQPQMEDTAKDIAVVARQKLEESREQVDAKEGGHGMGSITISAADSAISSQRLAGGITSGAIRQTVQGNYIGPLNFVTNDKPFFVTGLNNIQYRVSAMKSQMGDNDALVLVMQDRTDELSAKYRLRWLFASCVIGGLVLIFIASLYLSHRAIQPIDRSIQQQRAFVAAASHELRTPLAALGANAEILADAPLGEYAPYLDSVLHVSNRMTLLVSDLMDLARADAGELSVQMLPVDANEVAAKAVQWMRPLAEQKSIAIVADLQPTEMIGDSDRLRQILLALLDNAVRYAPQGGCIFVSVQRDGRYANIRVADTGPGIADEHKPHVFDRFYRIDQARSRENGGFGLGLSIVKQLVEQMEGTISLTDHVSGGAQFDIRFKTIG